MPDEREKFRIPLRQNRVVYVGFKGDVFVFPNLLEIQKAFRYLLAQVEFLSFGENLLVFKLVQPEYVRYERREVPAGCGDAFRVFKAGLFLQVRLLQHGGVVLDDRERGLQFVAHIADEVQPERLNARKFPCHQVDVVDYHVDFVPEMLAPWNLHRKIPLADGFRCVQKLLDGPFDFDFSVKAD